MKAPQLLCSDAYGSMLWNLSSPGAESFLPPNLNLRNLSQLTGLNKPEVITSARSRMALHVRYVPDGEKWRLGLASLLNLKTESGRP